MARKLILQYKDVKGVKIADKDMLDSLDRLGIDESRLLFLVGMKRASTDGYISNLIERMQGLDVWLIKDNPALPDTLTAGFKSVSELIDD